MTYPRLSGILLHPTSLPGPSGSGDLGKAAYQFIDWLANCQQSLWQVLPLGGLGPGNSPYMSPSAFAGNELLIDLQQLCDAGWLSNDELAKETPAESATINFGEVRQYRFSRLRLAAQRFFSEKTSLTTDFEAFCSTNKDWLDDYSLFMALEAEYGRLGSQWQSWPADIRSRKKSVINAATKSLKSETSFWKFCQWCFEIQWFALKRYANNKGIRIIGDIPIFVSGHSADVWAHQPLFDLDEVGHPRVIAGVPPDYFSASGQRWGNPLYNWRAHQSENFAWWSSRMQRMLTLTDIVRIDHFRGFEAYWEIAAEAQTAIDGQWKQGPGIAFFQAMAKVTPAQSSGNSKNFNIIAEDLGIITHEVTALRKEAGLPGMRVLQFAFGDNAGNAYLPHNYSHDSVVYTGTHDNDTTCGWWQHLPEKERDHVRRYLATDGHAINWSLIRAAMSSVASIAIFPLQDVMGLDSRGRMNTPGTRDGNWAWRFDWHDIAEWQANFLAQLTEIYGRNPLPKIEMREDYS